MVYKEKLILTEAEKKRGYTTVQLITPRGYKRSGDVKGYYFINPYTGERTDRGMSPGTLERSQIGGGGFTGVLYKTVSPPSELRAILERRQELRDIKEKRIRAEERHKEAVAILQKQEQDKKLKLKIKVKEKEEKEVRLKKETAFEKLDRIRAEQEMKPLPPPPWVIKEAEKELIKYPTAKKISIEVEGKEYKFIPGISEFKYEYEPTLRGEIRAEPPLFERLFKKTPERKLDIRVEEIPSKLVRVHEKTKSPAIRIGTGISLLSTELIKGAVKGPTIALDPRTYARMLDPESYRELGEEISKRPYKIGEILGAAYTGGKILKIVSKPIGKALSQVKPKKVKITRAKELFIEYEKYISQEQKRLTVTRKGIKKIGIIPEEKIKVVSTPVKEYWRRIKMVEDLDVLAKEIKTGRYKLVEGIEPPTPEGLKILALYEKIPAKVRQYRIKPEAFEIIGAGKIALKKGGVSIVKDIKIKEIIRPEEYKFIKQEDLLVLSKEATKRFISAKKQPTFKIGVVGEAEITKVFKDIKTYSGVYTAPFIYPITKTLSLGKQKPIISAKPIPLEIPSVYPLFTDLAKETELRKKSILYSEQELEQELEVISKPKLIVEQELGLRQKLIPAITLIQKPILDIEPITTTKPILDLEVGIKERPIIETKLKLEEQIVPPLETPSIDIPFLFPGERDLIGVGRKQKAYNVAAKHRGSFIRLNEDPLTRAAAISLGALAVDRSTSAQFRITKSRSKKEPRGSNLPALNLYKFRSYRIRGGAKQKLPDGFIEKTEHRIDTPKEFQGITVKGWLAARKKRQKENLIGSFDLGLDLDLGKGIL